MMRFELLNLTVGLDYLPAPIGNIVLHDLSNIYTISQFPGFKLNHSHVKTVDIARPGLALIHDKFFLLVDGYHRANKAHLAGKPFTVSCIRLVDALPHITIDSQPCALDEVLWMHDNPVAAVKRYLAVTSTL